MRPTVLWSWEELAICRQSGYTKCHNLHKPSEQVPWVAMLLTEVAMLASGDSKAGCQQPVKELPILSKPTHELSFNQKKKRRKKRAKLGRPVSAEVGLANLAVVASRVGPGCQQTLAHSLWTSWLQDWETASNDSVLTPQHGWPPGAGGGPEGCPEPRSMAVYLPRRKEANRVWKAPA